MITRFKEVWHNLTTKMFHGLYKVLFVNEARKSFLIHLAYGFILLSLFIISACFDLSFWADLLATLAAFLISAIFIYIFRFLLVSFEDRQKVNYDDSFMKDLYGVIDDTSKGEAECGYHRQFYLGDDICQVYYDCCLDTSTCGNDLSVEISDDPDKKFLPPQFVMENSLEIMKAHENSKIENTDTLRLDGYELKDNKLIIKTSRSNYIYHLLTNRAVDYKIADEFSLRQLFEYRCRLSSLESSVFSNHIGLIGLIMLNDGYTLLPHRSSKSTMSKNMVTSGIAKPMILDNSDLSFSTPVSEVPFKEYLLGLLPGSMKICAESLEAHTHSVRFLGFGRDVYEGGKPAFFYLINVNMSVDEYYAYRKTYSEQDSKLKVDSDKKIYVVRYDTIRWHRQGGFISFLRRNPYKMEKEKYIQPEKNLLCCFYHYQRYLDSIGGSEKSAV